MAENGREQPNDLETGNSEAGSSSMNIEITKESASTPIEPSPTSVNKENTNPDENSKSKGGTEEGTGNSVTTTTSKSYGCLVILLVVLIALLLPVYYLIKYACLIVLAIAAPKKRTIWVVLEWIALVGFTGFLGC
ncbi:hypothetical protein SLEP1_g18133 [Rubroshorea leprosula]|uniref:Uncharacterized protein n=1 Tax=Rubroshorea leprosula TaxID=152421 RepID=A0AAV5J214_9ROSI|nr:hypothetical protein SLEP1_g18133 [Rubroshorea leprosula]